jgi:hypothetical protein
MDLDKCVQGTARNLVWPEVSNFGCTDRKLGGKTDVQSWLQSQAEVSEVPFPVVCGDIQCVYIGIRSSSDHGISNIGEFR